MFWNKMWLFLIPYPRISGNVDLAQLKYVMKLINNNTDACEDFYSHACGNYENYHQSNHYEEITTFMDHQYDEEILNLMGREYRNNFQAPDHAQSFVEKTAIYLHSCRQESEKNPIKYFEEIKPGQQLNWPILEELKRLDNSQSNNRIFNVLSLLGKLQSYGLNNVLINHEILINRDGEISIILEPPSINNNTMLPNKTVLKQILRGLGIKKPCKIVNGISDTEDKLQDSVEFHVKINEKSRELTYGDLEKYYRDLRTYLTELLGRELPSDTSIVLKNPAYFIDFIYLQNQDFCNYLMMHFLLFVSKDSPVEFNSMACIKDTRNKLDLAVNFIFYRHFIAHGARSIEQDIMGIFQGLKFTLSKYFTENYLHLTNFQVQSLLDKLATVRLNIGNLPHTPNFQKVNNFYSNLPPLDKNNYYKNHLLLLKHRFRKSMHYPQTQTHFIVTDAELGSSSGAFYVPKQNMIILPFGSLLLPMYDIKYNDIFKYSMLGFILGHELTHAFDTNNLHVNSQGHDSTIDPWGLGILRGNINFQNSLNCMRSQLNTDCLNERIADTVGIRLAYDSYISKVSNLMPGGLHSIHIQHFYLNLAQFFCGKRNVKFIEHDPDSARLNLIVKNYKGFGQAFECPMNSRMNPSAKCRLF